MTTKCRETARVTGIDSRGRALVQVRRAEACHACTARGACQSLGGKTQDINLVVENTLGAEPGDDVELCLTEGSVIRASAVLYLLPATSLVLGCWAGWATAGRLGLGADPATFLGAGLGLAMGFLAAKLCAAKMSRSPKYLPELTAVLRRHDAKDTSTLSESGSPDCPPG